MSWMFCRRAEPHDLSGWRVPAVCLLLGHFVFAALWGLERLGALQALELQIYDHLLLGPWRVLTDERIILVGETESDIQRWGHPLPDGVLAALLERLAEGQPRVIGVDKYRNLPVPPGSERLDQVILNHPQILWVTKFGRAARGETAIAPPLILADIDDRIGFSDVPVDEGGMVRRGLLFMDDGHTVASAFALVVALRYLDTLGIRARPDPANPDHLRLGAATISPLAGDEGGYTRIDSAGYQYLLDYRGQLQARQVYSLGQVLDGQVPIQQLAGKIVLIGSMAVSLRDDFQIPVGSGWVDEPTALPVKPLEGRMAGVALHALQVNQLLRMALTGDGPVRGLPGPVEAGWVWLWCLAGTGLALGRLHLGGLFVLMAVALATLAGTGLLAFFQQLWLPLAASALGLTGAAILSGTYLAVQDRAEKRLLMRLLVRHVAPEVADALWRERQNLVCEGRLIPQRLTSTVLFVDIQGFTAIAERLEPAQLMDWLNTGMEMMSQAVIEQGGVIKQYVGDQMMALFGAPVPRQTEAEITYDAMQAVRCALVMSEQVEQLNAAWASQALPTIALRMGLCTGLLISGSLGGRQRIEYAVMGDTVNIASRLESFDKHAHFPAGRAGRILISQSTAERVDHRFQVTRIGPVRFQGKQQEIVVYRVEGQAITPDCAAVACEHRQDPTPPGSHCRGR